MENDLKEDIRLVQNVRRNAYIKDNNFTVGAVIKTKSGRKYTGCNIELSSLEIICAERVALEKAISEGERDFDYIIVMGGKQNQESEKYLPNKDCINFISKFVDEKFKLYVVYESKIEEYNFYEILNKNL